jgi:sirohydrochlorin ferrochelatase
MTPSLVLVAHGTRSPSGPRVIAELAARTRDRLPGVEVDVAYADVRSPDVTDVLAHRKGPVVVVPAFLGKGYHVRTDIPAQIEASGHADVALAEPFGPARELIDVAIRRLGDAGYRTGDRVVLAAAGSSDQRAIADVEHVADAMGVLLGTAVSVGYAATAQPAISDAVSAARAAGGRRAPWQSRYRYRAAAGVAGGERHLLRPHLVA